MISATQARKKQMSINWRDNKKAVAAYDSKMKGVLKNIEHEINETLTGEEQHISYFWHPEYFSKLEAATQGAEFTLAVNDMQKEIKEYLESLGYVIEDNRSYGNYWWNISWGDFNE